MAGMADKAEAAFRAGDLAGALAALQPEVRARPQDLKLRIFLAQLLMVLGQWDRALTQLSVVAELDALTLPMVHTCRAAIQCEQLRAAVYAGQRSPLVFGEPEPWMALLIQALQLQASGDAEQARSARAAALEQAPASAGTANGGAFEWIADADSRLGPVFEVLLNGAYYWIPVHRITTVKFEAPADVRDFVWMPATFVWSNGGEAVGLIPVRYPQSEHSTDPQIQMARKTEWTALGGEQYAGLGQRVLATDQGDFGLLDLRDLTLAAAS
jgi:type VI secretion system protein ImpE